MLFCLYGLSIHLDSYTHTIVYMYIYSNHKQIATVLYNKVCQSLYPYVILFWRFCALAEYTAQAIDNSLLFLKTIFLHLIINLSPFKYYIQGMYRNIFSFFLFFFYNYLIFYILLVPRYLWTKLYFFIKKIINIK